MYHPKENKLLGISRALRKNATKEEKHLWYDFLSGYTVRFRRQEIIGEYIADFYCSRAKLIIEIDGSQHYKPEAMEHDKNRTEYFESLGIRVIRFSNIDIHKHFEGVCYTIEEAATAGIIDPSARRRILFSAVQLPCKGRPIKKPPLQGSRK